VVEDEPDLLQLMNVSLSSLGHRVLTASSGEDALAIQERHDGPIHVLLSDIVMPGIRGTELANRIRSIRPETQVVLMTGYPGQNVGAADIKGEKILYKPIDFAELARILRAAADEAQRTLTA
jgi:DNA-binding NtrC family response regulator